MSKSKLKCHDESERIPNEKFTGFIKIAQDVISLKVIYEKPDIEVDESIKHLPTPKFYRGTKIWGQKTLKKRCHKKVKRG